MTILQILFTLAAGLIFVFAPYFEPYTDGFSFADLLGIFGLLCLGANIVVAIIFFSKERDRSEMTPLLLKGIRNVLLIPAPIYAAECHSVGFTRYEAIGGAVTEMQRFDIWDMRYLWIALGYAVAVFVLFGLIEAFSKRKKSKTT